MTSELEKNIIGFLQHRVNVWEKTPTKFEDVLETRKVVIRELDHIAKMIQLELISPDYLRKRYE